MGRRAVSVLAHRPHLMIGLSRGVNDVRGGCAQ